MQILQQFRVFFFFFAWLQLKSLKRISTYYSGITLNQSCCIHLHYRFCSSVARCWIVKLTDHHEIPLNPVFFFYGFRMRIGSRFPPLVILIALAIIFWAVLLSVLFCAIKLSNSELSASWIVNMCKLLSVASLMMPHFENWLSRKDSMQSFVSGSSKHGNVWLILFIKTAGKLHWCS